MSVDGDIVAVTNSIQSAEAVTRGYSTTDDIWVIEDRKTGIVEESVASEREQDRAEARAAAGLPPLRVASQSDLNVINKYRRSMGMPPIDRAAGWTDQELIDMAEQIRHTGRTHNARKRSLMR